MREVNYSDVSVDIVDRLIAGQVEWVPFAGAFDTYLHFVAPSDLGCGATLEGFFGAVSELVSWASTEPTTEERDLGIIDERQAHHQLRELRARLGAVYE